MTNGELKPCMFKPETDKDGEEETLGLNQEVYERLVKIFISCLWSEVD